MHQRMMYYADDERASELELAAAERQRGCSCSPFGRMISRAIKGRNGRQRRSKKERFDYAMGYPPAETYYVRPNARTITVTTTNHNPPVNAHVQTVPPEPTRAYAAMATPPPHAGAGGKPRNKKKKKKKNRVTFTPDAAGGPPTTMMPAGNNAPLPPHAGHHAASSGMTGAGSGGAAEPYLPAAPPPVQYHRSYGYGYGRYYAPSPLTRREAVVSTPTRRHEYFSGEYRWYYPTPVRASIYSFATDANHRLTNMFSEENPNACTIV